ncbi:SAD/SRA domain [Pelomyxa schiedti]|nr:SAD/SRA domain [Pelomyxa schiedti]
MGAAGMHRAPQGGISPAGDSSIAESIVVCKQYWDDDDQGDTLWFTGQGMEGDQQLIRGNAALSNAYDRDSPIRVIRGCNCRAGVAPSWGYRYDGLYKVVTYEQRVEGEEGGRLVWKFLLQRLEGQPEAPYKKREPSPPPPVDIKYAKRDTRLMRMPKPRVKPKKLAPRNKKPRLSPPSRSSSSESLSSASSSDTSSSDTSDTETEPESPMVLRRAPVFVCHSVLNSPRQQRSSLQQPPLNNRFKKKLSLDQFLSIHSAFIVMSLTEISEWMSRGLCAFCRAPLHSLTLEACRQHFGAHLKVAKSYLPKKQEALLQQKENTPRGTPPDPSAPTSADEIPLGMDLNSDREALEYLLAESTVPTTINTTASASASTQKT